MVRHKVICPEDSPRLYSFISYMKRYVNDTLQKMPPLCVSLIPPLLQPLEMTQGSACVSTGAVFVRNPLNRELVATFEIIVSVHDNASDIIDMSVSVPNGKCESSASLVFSVSSVFFIYTSKYSQCCLFLPRHNA